MTDALKDISKRFKTFRKSKDLTQQEVADTAGIQRSQLAAVEAGTQNPSYDLIYKVSVAYGLSIDWLVFGRGEMNCQTEKNVLSDLDPVFVKFINNFLKAPEKIQNGILDAANSYLKAYEEDQKKK